MADLILILLSAGLVNNLVLDYMVGVSPVVATSRKIDVATGMAGIMMLALVSATLVSYALKIYVLIPLQLEYLALFGYVFIIPLAILVVMKCLKNIRPLLYEEFNVFFPLILMNSAVTGVALVNVQQSYGLLGSLFFGAGAGLGVGLVLILFAAIQERVAVTAIPPPFKGTSIILITLGMISMAFMGFNGFGSH